MPIPELVSSSPASVPAVVSTASTSHSAGNSKTASQSAQQFLLPSTMMPPSVLASVCGSRASSANQSRNKNKNKRPHPSTNSDARNDNDKNSTNSGPNISRKSPKSSSSSVRSDMTENIKPQDYVNRILRERGYGETAQVRISAEKAGYDTVPSPLQLASFGTEVVKAVHTSDVKKLGDLISCGLSPNPCNQFRDSIVDLVCKRGNEAVFACLVEHGCNLRVCDGFGRTPLHHCCWAQSDFSAEIAKTIICSDWQQLFMEDKRGQTPLEYVRDSMVTEWLHFLEDNCDEFWPVGGKAPVILRSLKEERADGALPDPDNALPIPLATALSSGKVSPEQVRAMDENERINFVNV